MGAQWPSFLPDALYTMRSAKDAVSRTSPFQRLYGTEPDDQSSSWMGRASPWSTPPSHPVTVPPQTSSTPRNAALDAWCRARMSTHAANKRRHGEAQSSQWMPTVSSLVDWMSPIDSQGGRSRKMANYTRGPYKVIHIHPGGKTADVESTTPPIRTRRVYIGDLRPSAAATIASRPRPGWRPPWTTDSADEP